MAINSREKGKVAERHLASLIRDYGFPKVRRSQQYCGGSDESADLVGLPNIHIECKRVEKLNIHRAIDQAIRDNGDRDDIPCVFHRKNRERWLVTMTIEDFFRLYSASDYGKEKDEVEE